MLIQKSNASLSNRSLSRNQTSRESMTPDAMEYTPSLQSQYSYDQSESKREDCKASIEQLLKMNTAQFAAPPIKVDSQRTQANSD